MSLAPREYYSTDVGAPQLSGTVGSFIAVLDAVLVNGYGSKASLGWTKPFSGTNQAAYRNSQTLGTGRFMRVFDTNAQVALVRGFEDMTSVTTGTGQFPTSGQQALDTYVTKSANASSAERSWAIFGNARCFYFAVNVESNATLQNTPLVWFFGDFNSYVPGDVGTFTVPPGLNTSLSPNSTATQAGFVISRFPSAAGGTALDAVFAVANYGMYACRSMAGLQQPVPMTIGLLGIFAGGLPGSPSFSSVYPAGGGNALPLSRLLVKEEPFNGMLRGELPGIYGSIVNCSSIPQLAALSGLSDLPPGTQLRHLRFSAPGVSSTASNNGSVFIDITNNW